MFIVGITGFSCSGKTTLSDSLQEVLGKEDCLLISMDDYYKELTEEQAKILYNESAEINFDCPDAIDFDLLISHLECIFNQREVDLPRYDLGSCVVTSYTKVRPNQFKYVIIEGVFLFCSERLGKLIDLKIWTEASEYVCALRRFIKYSRDIKGYSYDYIYNQCIKFVIPGRFSFRSFLSNKPKKKFSELLFNSIFFFSCSIGQEKYIKPYKSTCDLIYNGENNDKSCVDMIAYLIKQKAALLPPNRQEKLAATLS
jgi:uridine kinase